MDSEESSGLEHQEAATMTIDRMVDMVWRGIQRGVYYPAELVVRFQSLTSTGRAQ